VFKEDKELKDSREDLVQQDLRFKEMEEIKDQLEILVIKDHKVIPIQVQQGIKVQQVQHHQKVSKVSKVPRV
jgi:hypothetical protein